MASLSFLVHSPRIIILQEEEGRGIIITSGHPIASKTADDAYRAMKCGLENSMLMTPGKNKSSNNGSGSSTV